MLTWIIAPGVITFLFVASIVATLIARRRSAEHGRIVATMHERSVHIEKEAAHRAQAAEHKRAS